MAKEKKEVYKKPSKVGKAIVKAGEKVGLIKKGSFPGDVYWRDSPGRKMTEEKAAKVKKKNPGLEKKSVLDKKYPLNGAPKQQPLKKQDSAKKSPARPPQFPNKKKMKDQD